VQKIKLKKTDLEISRIGLGTNAVGGHNLYSALDEEQGRALVREALSQGITFFDTADAYGLGRSEELLGEELRGKRQDVIIATKGAIQNGADGSRKINNRPEYLRAALEASLKRLSTDYVDLYYIHYVDSEVPLAESVGALERLREEGKIRAIGLSNATPEQLKEANQSGALSAYQGAYNLLQREAEAELLPYCVESGIAFIPYGPLAFGILGGKYNLDFKLSPEDWRNKVALFNETQFKENLHRVSRLKMIADERNTILPNLALAWLLHQKGVDAVIPGGKRPEQVAENVKAGLVTLTDEDLIKIQNAVK
jgi:aryl-alcohol dehydrogenase-like predicted oxidoreductase